MSKFGFHVFDDEDWYADFIVVQLCDFVRVTVLRNSGNLMVNQFGHGTCIKWEHCRGCDALVYLFLIIAFVNG